MCGINGFYPKKNKQVDLSKLYPLWVLNEERGTHSCGISYGPNREVGIDKYSKARDFINHIHESVVSENLINQPIICHTRHATNGSHSESNAHPFRWHRDKEDNFFTFAHNGVVRELHNFKKALGMSRHKENLMIIDSQVLGLAMYDSYVGILKEEDILTKYDGNAAFLCYDSNNVFKVWKGANNGVEERPMYYVETKEGWYFSSMDMGLAITFLQKPKMVPNNTLLTFANHKLQSSVVYERKVEIIPVTTKAVTPSGNFKDLFDSRQYNDTKSHSTTGLTILDNVLKLNLDNILDKKTAGSSKKEVVIELFGKHKGKYCIDSTLEMVPISGTLSFKTDSKTKCLDPTVSSSGRILTFQYGVLVQPGSSYYQVQAEYQRLKNISITTNEDIFNGLYDTVLKTIIDYIPLYDKGDLNMIIYMNNDKLDYITNSDTITTRLPSVFGMIVDAFPTKNSLYINIL